MGSNKGKKITASPMDWNLALGLAERLKDDKEHRSYLVFCLGIHFGLRASDLLQIKWYEVLGKSQFTLIEKKTKKHRTITINQKVQDALEFVANYQKQKEVFNESSYIFANKYGNPISISFLNKELKRIHNDYGLTGATVSTHSLRKTFGKRLFEKNNRNELALVYLSELFSHNSIGTTRRYIGLRNEELQRLYLDL